MDCYSAESEFIESLDFLSPPVKRIDSIRQAFGSAYNTDGNDVHLLRGFRNKFARLAPVFTKHTKAVKHTESSTSLVLKKTSEGQILGQQLSFVSFPSLDKPVNEIPTILKSVKKPNTSEKPLIKVTVIPKTDQVQAAKLLRRRKYIPKRVQRTTSNHENSIQTKNVYLIVAGRRREKVYEIKTTGSATLSTDHDTYSKNEDTSITELTNFKHLIRSLNMDRKKNKEKKPPAAADTSEAPHMLECNNFQKCNNCICVNEPKDRQAPKKSRVRIFGQFGISEEDKYVLRYGATVDDKTVMSDVAKLTRDFSPIIAGTSYGTTEEHSAQQQDSCLRAEYNYDLDTEKLPVMDAVSKESQGTQVNFNVEVAAAKGRCATFSDKKVQCSCCGNRSDQNPLKDCQSPMVIISVYPKQSPEDVMQSAESARSPSPEGMNTYTSNHVLKTEKAATKIDTKRNIKRSRMSRSPSPARKPSKPKVLDNSFKGPVSEKRSPDRQKALRAIKEKIREKDNLKQDASSRKLPLKLNMINATQVSKNQQNVTVSNATQVSKRNQRLNAVSQATQMSNENYQNPITFTTQVSTKKIKKYTASNGTQYSNEAERLSASTQCQDSVDSMQDIAPIKHSINDAMSSNRNPQPKYSPIEHLKTQVSNATQAPKQIYLNQSTQVPKSDDPLTISCATQVSKDDTKVIAPRVVKYQEIFTAKPAQGFKSGQTSRYTSKTKAESGTNTDHAQTKKALVETYTKKLTEQMTQNEYVPTRYDSSKVRVNIDSDRELYDVLFNQDTLRTDLRIRKTLKDMDSQKSNKEPSLECFLRLPKCAVNRGGFNSGNKSPSKSPPVALSNNPSDDELGKNVSRLTIRDSLEICHRREERSNQSLKNTQTHFATHLVNEAPEETEFLVPMKHFTGDNCSICDPIERDRQIRELLGVDKIKPNHSKSSQGHFCENDVGIPYQCIYRQQCKESQVTEINYEFHKLCPCFCKPKKKATVSVQCRQGTCKARNSNKKEKENCPELCFVNYTTEGNVKKDDKTSAIYQQLVLNRNIQVFLQVEQFSKQKPIVLSRQQYDKVKKTIQKTLSSKKSSQDKRKTLLSKHESSGISIGEVRTKKVRDAAPLQKKAQDPEPIQKRAKEPESPQKQVIGPSLSSTSTQESQHDIAAQTQGLSCTKFNCKFYLKKTERKGKTLKQKANIDMKGDGSSDENPDSSKDKVKKDKKKESAELKTILKPRPEVIIERDAAVGDGAAQRTERFKKPENSCSMCCVCDEEELKGSELQTYVLFNAETTRDNFKDAKETEDVAHTRKTISSVQIRYASVAFMKQVAYSSTNVGAVSNTSIGHVNSFQTLFRGHRKCATPNLGTSAYSLYSEGDYNSENKCAKLEPQDSKPKKPFLRRLMSCLVMRSTRQSQLQLPSSPPDLTSVNSSIDSYHISTSLGAVEVTSSIYDTSASFYSNHTILPITNKIKRGFFSSVRGFLTNRRS